MGMVARLELPDFHIFGISQEHEAYVNHRTGVFRNVAEIVKISRGLPSEFIFSLWE